MKVLEKPSLPTQEMEEWRFFPVDKLTDPSFQMASKMDSNSVLDQLPSYFLTSSKLRFVFVNGHFIPALSLVVSPIKEVRLDSIAQIFKDPLLQKCLSRFPEDKLTAFTHLNTDYFKDGAFLYIPKSTVLETPVEIYYFSYPEVEIKTVTYPKTLIYMERNSQLKVIENYIDLEFIGSQTTLTNSYTQIYLGEDSHLEHIRIQRSTSKGYSFSQIQALQERNSHAIFHSISLSGKLIRNNIVTTLEGEGAECALNGFYMAGANEWVDNHTLIEHANSHTFSRESYKGILEGKSRAVFNGRIVVEKGAQKTDALQSNKNLLLSNEALVYTKPELEIFANDVKCKHGATIGQLDHDVLFYLRSRGIPLKEARKILIYAFASEMIDKITIPSLKEALTKMLFLKMMEGQP